MQAHTAGLGLGAGAGGAVLVLDAATLRAEATLFVGNSARTVVQPGASVAALSTGCDALASNGTAFRPWWLEVYCRLPHRAGRESVELRGGCWWHSKARPGSASAHPAARVSTPADPPQ